MYRRAFVFIDEPKHLQAEKAGLGPAGRGCLAMEPAAGQALLTRLIVRSTDYNVKQSGCRHAQMELSSACCNTAYLGTDKSRSVGGRLRNLILSLS